MSNMALSPSCSPPFVHQLKISSLPPAAAAGAAVGASAAGAAVGSATAGAAVGAAAAGAAVGAVGAGAAVGAAAGAVLPQAASSIPSNATRPSIFAQRVIGALPFLTTVS